MEKKFKAEFVRDLPNKKISVRREFDASPELVWKAWTESKLLDQWWAPKPWQAKTKSFTFKEGGKWLYAMCGPDGTMIWSQVEFSSISKNNSFKAISCFSDEDGNKNPTFPTLYWKNDFVSTGSGTRVEVEIHFTSEADIQQIIAMGFEGGFSMGLDNLDELLAKYELQNS